MTARWVLVGLTLLACGGEVAPMDAGRDARVGGDASEVDAGRLCERGMDCDDGVFCNGVEECVDARCQAGTPACDAGEECLEDMDMCRAIDCSPEMADRDDDHHRSLACMGDDCDDDDPNRYRGLAEVCDPEGHDEDCDPSTYGFRDADLDGDPDMACCNGEVCGTDCDDMRPGVNSRVPEVCGNGLDDDCDGSMDEELLVDGFADADGDGWGDDAVPMTGVCPGTPGFAVMGGDCDEGDAAINPGATEACDTIDNDCDGTPDDGLPTMRCYRDTDGDGYGVTSDFEMRCGCGSGWAVMPGDCADREANAHPGASWRPGGYCPGPFACSPTSLSGDWNCDGISERRYPVDCASALGCSPIPDCSGCDPCWVSAVPDCDDPPASLRSWNVDCTQTTASRAQECR